MSDRPVTIQGALSKEFVLALPLTPRKVFLTASRREILERLKKRTQDAIVKELNRVAVGEAEVYVYASSQAQEPFVRRHLSKK
jgi:hypothetical protein